ncbi:hypothetical protein DYU11_20175 [Fibrisoma montanum]|uniref:Uncharacterized protein n=1 Tax=Fibrisoma montanum TaxID=2305895 RepID=A0A418M3Q3_9BACT|nr:hypothetical protein [Fibrisoma montanum]RIV20371.1 hypothetical protein DYU11_20175 [Fibrisoma montanum]
MSNLSNCQPNPGGSPEQAVRGPAASVPSFAVPETAQQFLEDWFSDPNEVNVVRRNLRAWFMGNVENWDSNFGSTLALQILYYEMLDEFLSLRIADLTKPTE